MGSVHDIEFKYVCGELNIHVGAIFRYFPQVCAVCAMVEIKIRDRWTQLVPKSFQLPSLWPVNGRKIFGIVSTTFKVQASSIYIGLAILAPAPRPINIVYSLPVSRSDNPSRWVPRWVPKAEIFCFGLFVFLFFCSPGLTTPGGYAS